MARPVLMLLQSPWRMNYWRSGHMLATATSSTTLATSSRRSSASPSSTKPSTRLLSPVDEFLPSSRKKLPSKRQSEALQHHSRRLRNSPLITAKDRDLANCHFCVFFYKMCRIGAISMFCKWIWSPYINNLHNSAIFHPILTFDPSNMTSFS